MKVKAHFYNPDAQYGSLDFQEFDEYDDNSRLVIDEGLDSYTINKHYDEQELD